MPAGLKELEVLSLFGGSLRRPLDLEKLQAARLQSCNRNGPFPLGNCPRLEFLKHNCRSAEAVSELCGDLWAAELCPQLRQFSASGDAQSCPCVKAVLLDVGVPSK